MFDQFLEQKVPLHSIKKLEKNSETLNKLDGNHRFCSDKSLQVLGEYCHLKEDLEPATVLKLMANLLDLKTTSSETKTWVLLAMTKLCGSSSRDVSVVREVCETFSSSLDTVLRQRAQELQHLSQDPHLRARVLPRESSREPLEVTSPCRTVIL